MDKKKFTRLLLVRAKEAGFTDCEVYYTAGSEFSASVFHGETTSFSVSDNMGLSFRGLINGRMGYAATQILDEDALEMLISAAKSNAELIEDDDPQEIFAGSDSYGQVSGYDPALDGVTTSDKLDLCRSMERAALAVDSRISQVAGCRIFSEVEEIAIVNSRGLDLSMKRGTAGGYIGPVAKDGDNAGVSGAMFVANHPDELRYEDAVSQACREALDYLAAGSLTSGQYKVCLRGDVMSDLIRTFSSIFSAEAAQKGLSLLKGREGEFIASPAVTLIDDPLMPDQPASTPFDGEGVATHTKRVIDGGRLTTLLHNLKTAKKQGVASTGNASRPSYTSPVGISPFTFYLEKGNLTRDELLSQVGDGVLITDVAGLHAGANPVSGDFSLSAKGYRIEGGKVTDAVRGITVSGNFYELLKNISLVADDLEFGFPGTSRPGSPTVYAGELSIAGK